MRQNADPTGRESEDLVREILALRNGFTDEKVRYDLILRIAVGRLLRIIRWLRPIPEQHRLAVAEMVIFVMLVLPIERLPKRDVGEFVGRLCRRTYDAYIREDRNDGPRMFEDVVVTLRDCLLQMKPADRDILADKILRGLSIREISSKRGLSFKEVAQVIGRFFSKLRRH